MAMMPPRPEVSTRALGVFLAILFMTFPILPSPSHANEISVLAGPTEGIDTGDGSFAWQAAFRYNFLRNFATTLS